MADENSAPRSSSSLFVTDYLLCPERIQGNLYIAVTQCQIWGQNACPHRRWMKAMIPLCLSVKEFVWIVSAYVNQVTCLHRSWVYHSYLRGYSFIIEISYTLRLKCPSLKVFVFYGNLPLLKDPCLQWARVLNNSLGEPASDTQIKDKYINARGLTERSLFQHSRPSQSHGIRCVQRRDSNHHGLTLHSTSQPPKKRTINFNRPGAEARGLVVPSIARPVLTASSPCQTIPTTGPEAMYLINPGKNGFSLRSA